MEETSLHFPPLGEFEFVRRILDRSCTMDERPPDSRFWFGPGDDAAAFDGWLATKDLSAENTHFRLDWSSPEEAVEKCIVSNVSDISAMGGIPSIALLGLCVSRHWEKSVRLRVADAFAAGFRKRGISLVGGDVVASDSGLFSVTLLGRSVGKPLRRSGAHPGEKVFLSGPLGASAAGLWAFLHGKQDDPELAEVVRYHCAPAIDELCGSKLVKAGVCGACIDISDGLSSELNHIALSSKVRLRIDEKAIPVHPGAVLASKRYGVGLREFWLNGGEEYRLLFTSDLPEAIFRDKKNPVYPIGEVLEGSGVTLRSLSGQEEIILAGSWSHL